MESRADALVLFGATGDLVRKKLIPAIYELAAAGRLGLPVIGVARSNWDDEKLGAHTHDVLGKSGPLDETGFAELAPISPWSWATTTTPKPTKHSPNDSKNPSDRFSTSRYHPPFSRTSSRDWRPSGWPNAAG